MPNYSGVWTLSQQFQGRGQGLWPTPPGAPTIGTATRGGVGIANVAFTAPACAGIPAVITGYIARSTPGCITATGSSSPIAVSGLCSSTAYTFAVAASNTSGTGSYSAQSNSVTPNGIGQDAYTTAGSYTWVKPAGITSVSIVAVGAGGTGQPYFETGEIGGCWCGYGGGGGGGGGLAYRNNYDVSARSSLQIIVGAGGTSNSTVNTCTGALIFSANKGGNGSGNAGAGGGGAAGTLTGYYIGGAGGTGGYSACCYNTCGGGGGGAAGYTGNGGAGSLYGGSAGSGGSGGGGSVNTGGGGVGILGQGASGTANGGGGSGGANSVSFNGGAYGGGGSGYYPGVGASGAVRIIYPGNTRSFPSTCTGNL